MERIILTPTSALQHKNPGNGKWRIVALGGIKTITVVNLLSEEPIMGVLTFKVGSKELSLDLSAGERWLSLFGLVPYIDVDITGVNPEQKFDIIIL